MRLDSVVVSVAAIIILSIIGGLFKVRSLPSIPEHSMNGPCPN